MNHRVFIAVNLPQKVKDRLYSTRDNYPGLPARWTKKENLHLTLLFLGSVSDQELFQVCQSFRETAKNHVPFVLELNRIDYAPNARLVWASGKSSKELGKLQQDLHRSFFDVAGNGKEPGFAPHVTLARIKEWEFKKLEPEEVPAINEEISLSFPVETIELMESELKREGPEYAVLESAPLG